MLWYIRRIVLNLLCFFFNIEFFVCIIIKSGLFLFQLNDFEFKCDEYEVVYFGRIQYFGRCGQRSLLCRGEQSYGYIFEFGLLGQRIYQDLFLEVGYMLRFNFGNRISVYILVRDKQGDCDVFQNRGFQICLNLFFLLNVQISFVCDGWY